MTLPDPSVASSVAPSASATANRRQMLRTLGWGVAALGSPWGLAACAGTPATHAGPRGINVTNAPVANASNMQDRVDCFGLHQAGVTTPRPVHGMIASFAVLADSPDALERLLRRLSERCVFLTQGGTPPELHPQLPPADSGILGPEIAPDALTITVSLGSSLFDDRPWLAPLKPRRLSRMTRFPNDALDAALCHGDLSLQICANTQDTTIHALRDIIKNLSDQLVPRWKQQGNVPVIPPLPDGRVENARNFLGFRDGSANPDANDATLMERIVWVDETRDEPLWAQGGSYQAVRIIRNFVERWDRTPLREQEQIFGRTKMSGAPLDQLHASEFEVPDYPRDPDGEATPHDAHIRLANPRTPESEANLMLRRPFNYSNGILKNGQLDQGLLFICYQADLEQGFIAVQRRLDGEPLEEYIKPVGGGYFYTLPGMRDAHDYLGSRLVVAARTLFSSSLKG